MAKATSKPIDDVKRFIVVENDSVVFQCGSALEGMAFIEGRRGGVLFGVLYRPRPQVADVERQRARPARKPTRKVAKAG